MDLNTNCCKAKVDNLTMVDYLNHVILYML